MAYHGIVLGVVSVAALATAAVAPVAAPSFKVGDSWVFDQTVQRGTQGFDERRIDVVIERTGAETMQVGTKRDGAPSAYQDHMVGTDWSIRRIIDGREEMTARPFQFPMTPGRTWTMDVTDPTPRGLQTSLHIHRTYTVLGWEDVTVPAGTFHAIKVEASGIDNATMIVPSRVAASAASSPVGGTTMTSIQRGGTKSVTVKTHAELYYVPAVKNYVKSLEEQYSTDEILLSRNTNALVSYKPAA